MTDQEIQDALKVDPSPEFLARVRTRIANEPAPSAWRWSWGFAAAVAMAAIVLVAIVWSRPRQTTVAAPGVVAAPDVAQAFRPAEGPAGPKGSALQATEPTSTVAVRRPGPSGPGAPIARLTPRATAARFQPRATEVLLDPAETRALRGLIAGVREGRLDLTAVVKSAAPAPMDLEPVTDIVIAPITIDPIAPPPGAEGVRP